MMKEPGALKSRSDSNAEEKRVREINWEGVFWVIILPMIGLIAAAFTPLQTKTAIWAVIYHITTGVGITAGPCSLSNQCLWTTQNCLLTPVCRLSQVVGTSILFC